MLTLMDFLDEELDLLEDFLEEFFFFLLALIFLLIFFFALDALDLGILLLATEEEVMVLVPVITIILPKKLAS